MSEVSYCHRAEVKKTDLGGWKCTACDMPCDLFIQKENPPEGFKVIASLPTIEETVIVKEKKPRPKPKAKTPKGCMCRNCGDKKYPYATKQNWGELIVKWGVCKKCKSYSLLIPLSEWIN